MMLSISSDTLTAYSISRDIRSSIDHTVLQLKTTALQLQTNYTALQV